MKRSSLINKVSKQSSNFSKVDVEEGLKHILDFITKSLAEKNRIELRGFGTFSVRKRPARIGRNPKTGTSITIDSGAFLIEQIHLSPCFFIFAVVFFDRSTDDV